MNKTVTFTIRLLSDTCCGNGTGNGSDVDVSACFDEFGLPVIPARRLKGLLRENALLLAENGYCTKEKHTVTIQDIYSLFGADGGKTARIKIENAYIKDAQVIADEIKGRFTAKEVSETFSQKRHQTAIDDLGVAKKTSLRLIETVVKGTEFKGIINIIDATEYDAEIIEKSLILLRHIGLDKSRGLGEVICENIVTENVHVSTAKYNKTDDKIERVYTVTLLQDVSLMQNSPMKNPNYLSGSCIQGAFAKHLIDVNSFDELFFNDALFTNAYISSNGEMYMPAPLSLIAVKNSDDKVYSVADGYIKDDKNQYVPVNGYVNINKDKISIISPKCSTEQHINRKLDLLYPVTKLRKGQVFKGSVFASSGAISTFEQMLKDCGGIITVGASGTAQYGKCRIELSPAEEKQSIIGDTLIVYINSNTIILDEYANNSVRVCDLINELKKIIQFSDYDIYAKTETVGGFNSKWGTPKCQYESFSKGSVVVLKNCELKTVPKCTFVGIGNEEGFGQIFIRTLAAEAVYEVSEKKETPKPNNLAVKAAESIISKILKKRLHDAVVLEALNDSKKSYDKFSKDLSNSSAMRILSLYQALKYADKMEEHFKATYTNSFEKYRTLLSVSEEICKNFDALKINHSLTDEDENEWFGLYLRTFIGRYKELYQNEKRREVSVGE